MKISGYLKLRDTNNKKKTVEGDASFDVENKKWKLVQAEGDISFVCMNASEVVLSGNVTGKNINCETIRIEGNVQVDSIDSIKTRIEGSLRINRFESDECNISFSSNSRIKVIRGKEIRIYPEEHQDSSGWGKIFKNLFNMKINESNSLSMQIDELSANRIEIKGPCKINKLYYRDSYDLGKNVLVKKIEQID